MLYKIYNTTYKSQENKQELLPERLINSIARIDKDKIMKGSEKAKSFGECVSNYSKEKINNTINYITEFSNVYNR